MGLSACVCLVLCVLCPQGSASKHTRTRVFREAGLRPLQMSTQEASAHLGAVQGVGTNQPLQRGDAALGARRDGARLQFRKRMPCAHTARVVAHL